MAQPTPINIPSYRASLVELREAPGSVDRMEYPPTQWMFDWMSAVIQAIMAINGGGAGVIGSTVYDTGVLAAGTTAISTTAPTANGQILFVQVVQNPAGNGRITWAAMFHPATPTGLNFDANAVSIFSFVSIGLLWTPFTNMHSLV